MPKRSSMPPVPTFLAQMDITEKMETVMFHRWKTSTSKLSNPSQVQSSLVVLFREPGSSFEHLENYNSVQFGQRALKSKEATEPAQWRHDSIVSAGGKQ